MKWDVRLKDKIEYFDPKLSYEITKYIPINEKESLDFDPKPFTEVGQVKIKTGKYCQFPKGTKAYRDFWEEQMERCKNGYQVGKYRVTGDHYFFLNFYQLEQAHGVDVAGTGRNTAFPTFLQAQYEYFHYIEIAESLKLDVVTLKSRGVGWSEIQAAMGQNKYTTTKKYKSLFTAFYDDYLVGSGGVVTKCWDALEFLNTETEGGMRRLRMQVNTQYRKRQSVLDSEKNETGHMAEIAVIITDKPRKLRGSRVDRLFFEEAGSNENLTKLWTQSLALVSIQGNKFGTRIQFGTGGDTGPQLIGLEKIFYNPQNFKVLPYRHNFTKTGTYVLTQYFVPQYACQIKFIDHRGVTNYEKAKAYFEEDRERNKNDLQEYLNNCQEYCFTPDEQLSRQGVNQFNQVKLSQQRMEIELHKTVELPERGNLEWIKDNEGNITGVRWEKSSTGKILRSEAPVLDETGRPLINLYVSGIDSIDQGVIDSVVGERGSKFACLIKKRTFGLSGDKYVCAYVDRPQVAKDAYEIAQKMLFYYGCKANLEDTKITFRQYLRERKWDNVMLMKRPQYGLENTPRHKYKVTSNLWGTPGSVKMINHGLELIADYIEDFVQNMNMIEMIEQLQKYSYENKTQFDIISAMIMTEIGDEDMYNTRIKERESTPQERKDVGYYVDEFNRRRWGVIPNKIENNQKWLPKSWRMP